MAALSFALVEDVRLLQAYIRGRFVLLQRQSFIEEPLVLWMPALNRPCTMGQFCQVDGEQPGFEIIFGLFHRF